MTSYLRRISPPMAVAILALVIAVSSSATAALVISGQQIKDHSITGKDLKKNAVKSKTIKNKTVKGKDLRKAAVKSKHVRDGSLSSADLRSGSITSEKIADGSLTLSDVSKSLTDALDGGAGGFEVVTATSDAVLPLQTASVSAACPSGKVATGANAYWLGQNNINAPQVRRNGPASFTATSSFPIGLLGADSVQLQVSCVTA